MGLFLATVAVEPAPCVGSISAEAKFLQGTATQNASNIQHVLVVLSDCHGHQELLKLVAWAQEDNQVTHTKSNVKQNSKCTITCHSVTRLDMLQNKIGGRGGPLPKSGG